MKKIYRLVSVQLWSTLGDILSIGTGKKKLSKTLHISLLFFVLILGGAAFLYSFAIGTALKMFGSLELLPALMMSAASIIVLMTTVFKVKGTVFGFKDYDMVMALPVSTGMIAISRLVLLYSVNILFVLILMIPMLIAYGILATPGITFYVVGVLTIFIIPLIPIIIATFIGTIITYAASKFRYSNVANIIISLTVLVFFIISSGSMQDGSEEELVNISRILTDRINSVYPLAGLYKDAITKFNIPALFLFLSISLAAFLLYAFMIGRIFKKLNTIIMTGKARADYKMQELRQSTPIKALYVKELKRYFSSTIYVLNTGIGIVILTIATIALIFVDPNSLFGDAQVFDMIKGYAPIFISFCVIMSCTTMASISLEGNNLWIVKALPVTPESIFLAKLYVNFTIIAPAVIDGLLLGILLKTSFVTNLFIVAMPVICAVFIAYFGLLINLKFPIFDWKTETAVVKQSVATLITIFSGMVVVGSQVLFLVILPTAELGYLMYAFLILIAIAVLRHVLMTWGVKRFKELP